MAKTRQGTECQSPAIKGKKRCRMHGGKSPGAPLGNQHNFKHGLRSAAMVKRRRIMRALLAETRTTMDAI
ncbi:HGGxSTG domain-containing protein [Sphingobium chungbukense]|uniref:HGGxSTG domain-containing protein n=1 Tax=Sphingobium chungbukense TaxID=56193 RepID=UPI001E37F1EE|nr:HGGxSTG domain-containing protein [Sphingobium chungbukense]